MYSIGMPDAIHRDVEYCAEELEEDGLVEGDEEVGWEGGVGGVGC